MSERAKFTRGGRSIMSFLSHTLGFLLEGGCQCARFPSSTNKMWGWVVEIKFPCTATGNDFIARMAQRRRLLRE